MVIVLVHKDYRSFFPPNVILLKEKVLDTNMEMVKNDVLPLIKNPGETDIW